MIWKTTRLIRLIETVNTAIFVVECWELPMPKNILYISICKDMDKKDLTRNTISVFPYATKQEVDGLLEIKHLQRTFDTGWIEY